MRRGRAREQDTHQDRWLVSYADFVTLLFALFVVLFASSYHDKKTIQRVSAAMRSGFQEMGSFSPKMTDSDSPSMSKSEPEKPAIPPGSGSFRPFPVPPSADIDVVALRSKLSNALGKEIERQEVDMRMTPEGFVISLHELGFFNSGEARLTPGATDKIKRIASVLVPYGMDMRVEGHSDNVPIHNTSFASNWDLSTARATVVAMMLLNESGVNPKRISIAGYGQYHPAASNDTAGGRRTNRRVDIVVVSALRPSESAAH